MHYFFWVNKAKSITKGKVKNSRAKRKKEIEARYGGKKHKKLTLNQAMSVGEVRDLSFSIVDLVGGLSVDVQQVGNMSPLYGCIRYDLEP